ncbi:MAG: TIGR02452 family protein [Clostridiales bacterium]|nr:TIGR02452 family protein [Clostridiales bacterium]
MSNNPQYNWQNKGARAQIAEARTKEMAERYRQEISSCVAKTQTYRGQIISAPSQEPAASYTELLVPLDSVSAAYQERNGKTAILNFASYKHPGGGFLVGSRAQEECLCHESFLYNVLSQQQKYYAQNNKTLNRALYTNAALYTPDVMFEHNGEAAPFDVLTCASPDFGTAAQYYHVSKEENSAALRSRIRFVLDILNEQHVNTAILGAFGCGVFCQDGTEVAKLFQAEAARTAWRESVKLVYAVIDSARGGNYQKFGEVFGKAQ